MPAKATAQKTTTKTTATRKSLPPVSELFSDAFETFKRTAVNLVGVWLIQGVIAIAIFIAAIIAIVVAAIATGAANPELFSQLQSDPSSVIGVVGGIAAFGGVMLLALIVLFMYLGAAFQAAAITVMASKEKVEIGQAISTGFKSAWPLVLVTLITSFFVMGSFMLLFIPALIVGIFLSMSLYEVILEKRRGMAAVRASVSIVSQNFWSIFGRMVLFMVGTMIANLVVNGVIAGLQSEPGTAFLGIILSIVWQFALTAYSLAFSFTLYRHAKAAAVDTRPSLRWLWIVTILGYVIGLLLFGSLIKTIPTLMKTVTENAQNQDSAATEMLFDEGEWPETSTELQQALDEVDQSKLTPEQQESMEALRQYVEALPE